MSGKLIVALDFPSAHLAQDFVAQLSPDDCKLKVGFELFVAAGPDFVKGLVDAGFDVFLDLKFHDIPNTVASVCRAAAGLGVWMINVHASGGERMMMAAREALEGVERPPLLIAVTVLTSMGADELKATGVAVDDTRAQVLHLAQMANKAGLDGAVCSAQEAALLKKELGPEFLLVTPGIRPTGSEQGDQVRIMTPGQASEAGIDYVVVGRPVTRSETPLSIIRQINRDLVVV